jgi:hypothetical protein
MKKLIYVHFIFILCINLKTFATEQTPDYLIYKGDTLEIQANPMESYFNESNPRPGAILNKCRYTLTGCWRGYIGYWELKNDSLFLTKLKGKSCDTDLSLIFKDKVINGKVFASWYNLSFIHPFGKQTYNDWMGYSAVYEYEEEFVFSNGILKALNNYDNTKANKSKYFQDGNLLKEYLNANLNTAILPDTLDKVRVVVAIRKVNAEGKIDSVIIMRGFNTEIDNEALRVVKSIPAWNTFYKHGKLCNDVIWMIPVVFERKKKQ